MLQCKEGFSLIEILIAVAILSLLGLATGGVVYNTFQAKTNAERDIEVIDIGRSILRIMKRDINLAFHRAKKGIKSSGGSVKIEKNPADENMTTYFIGKDSEPYDELNFTSLSHRRFYKNSHESEQTEIGYYVEADEDDESRMNLYRRESKIIDDKPSEGGTVYKFAEYITFLSFKYWDCKKEKFVDSWDSLESQEYKGKFPEAVEIRFGLDDFKDVEGGSEKVFETVVIVQMPNNLTRRVPISASKDDASKLNLSQQNKCKECKEKKTECPSYCPSDDGKKKDEPLLLTLPSGSCTQ